MITFSDERSKYKKSRVSASASRENIRKLLEAGVPKSSITNYGKRLNPGEARRIYSSYLSSRPATPTPATATPTPTTPVSTIPAGATGINKAYEEAKKTYLDFLPSLRPRYDELRKQLAESQAITLQKEEKMAEEEQAQLKRNVARKGLEVSGENQFYTGEKAKLAEQEALRERETRLGFAGKRLEIETAESQDIRDIRSMVAGLSIDQAKALRAITEYNKEFEYRAMRDKVADKQWKESFTYQKMRDRIADKQWKKSFSYQKKLDKEAERQWKKTFAYTKDKDTADRALAYAELAKKYLGKTDKYSKDLASYVGLAYSGKLSREAVIKMMMTSHPDKESQIRRDIYGKLLPDGWESEIKGDIDEETLRELMDDIDKGATMGELIEAYPDIPADKIKKYYE